jgi:hypothetical protein
MAVAAACAVDCPLPDLTVDLGALGADAGWLLRDAGTWMIDAGKGMISVGHRADASAKAQYDDYEHYDVNCDEAYEFTQSGVAGADVTTSYFARAVVDSTEDIVSVDVKLCDRETFGEQTAKPLCAQGFACSGSNGPEPTECVVQTGAELGPNFVRASCGYRASSNYAGGQFERGSRYQTVHIVVRRR